MNKQYTVIHYEDNGNDIYQEWLDDLRNLQAQTAIDRIIKRIEKGNFGDHKYLRDGVSELRIHVGAGYRVYYSIIENIVVLLLCGGTKSTQKQDINKAVSYLKDFKKENEDNGY